MTPTLLQALTGYATACAPEAVLGVAACVLFLGGAWKPGRHLWGAAALIALAVAGVAVALSPMPTAGVSAEQARVDVFASPVVFDHLTLFVRVVALIGGALLVLLSWDEVPAAQAADYHACLLVITAGVSLTAAANELVTLFLALELISIPTYVLLYLPRTDAMAQEAAMKYFLLSIFSSAFLLFGFSYLYGLGGTTNLPAVLEGLSRDRGAAPGMALTALVMVVAGLGFRIAAVPFHFYAPDVYQGTSTAAAAMLAFVPKVAGFVALVRVLGYLPSSLAGGVRPGLALSDQSSNLFVILAVVTMSLGNVLALLQDNVKRLLAYSSVAHAGYMLIGLAAAPLLAGLQIPTAVGGVEAVLFYLVSYSAMTLGAFGVLSLLSTPDRPIETINDLAGLGRSRPGAALLFALFLFSLIGIPMTAGFMGKWMLLFAALAVPHRDGPTLQLYDYLALIAVLNAAIGGYYYLRIAGAMFLREPLQPITKPISWPVLSAVWVCAILTLAFGVYPEALRRAAAAATSTPVPASALALAAADQP